MSRAQKISLLIALYFAQGLPFGFFTIALPAMLRQSGQSPQGSLARAATRSPGLKRVAPLPFSRTRAQNSWPKSWIGASVSSRRLMRS